MLVLIFLQTGVRIGRKDLAELGHGGICLACRYPQCGFGKILRAS